MGINSIGTSYQSQASATYNTEEQKKPENISEINKLEGEIKEKEVEFKETMKEAQKTAGESMSGASEKAQLLQSKMLMQQQAIAIKQMQIKDIQSSKETSENQSMVTKYNRPRYDQFISTEKEDMKKINNVNELKEKIRGVEVKLYA